MKKVMMGNHAVSHGAMLSRVDVIAAYPITPQTQVVEELSELCASGRLDARFIKVESEHSAMAACVGASQTGARAFTATSSQGLALMHEVLHWAAGGRLPIVLANINRAMGPGWNIWADQNDSLSQRDTGFMQVYCESNQEVLDWTIMAFKIAETVRVPMMINLDAFFLSHTYEMVDLPDQADVDAFLPKARLTPNLDINDPHAFNALVTPAQFFEIRVHLQQSMEEAKRVIVDVGKEFGEHFGRSYGLTSDYMLDDAKIALVTSGTASGTARVAIRELRKQGVPVGQLKMQAFRPFPTEEVRDKLAGVEKIAVLDRNFSWGAGGIFAQEIKAALYNAERRPQLYGYIAGIGGRDITPETIKEIIRKTEEADRPKADYTWIGVMP
ncbi:MAG TPA: pyruvate ferredoxin oxidoreductase [Acidobacteriota bacterium]|nr:pyruvate ferredoxin oxidoreductase [Acidobacteriota bacterium]